MVANTTIASPRYEIKISAQNQWEDYEAHLKYISENEVWWPVKDFEDLYEVSSFGRVKSLGGYKRTKGNALRFQKEKIAARNPTKGDYYLRQKLCREGKIVGKGVHEIVAETFLIVPLYYDTINHKDGDKQNNAANNLEFNSYLENNLHARAIGLNNNIAEYHCHAKLTNEQVLEIAKSKEIRSVLAKKYGVSTSAITIIRTGKGWSTITGISYRRKKLTPESVIDIFTSPLPYRDLSIKHNTSESNICLIKTGKSWAHITNNIKNN